MEHNRGKWLIVANETMRRTHPHQYAWLAHAWPVHLLSE
jgi:hypothetical protein